jgi:hypothetical protein
LCGLRGPGSEVFGRFQDLDRHFVIIFQRLFGIGLEGLHASVSVKTHCGLIGFEEEPGPMNNAEEYAVSIKPISPEHGAAGEAAEIGQLIQDEVFETVVFLSHGKLTGASAPPRFEQRSER